MYWRPNHDLVDIWCMRNEKIFKGRPPNLLSTTSSILEDISDREFAFKPP